MIVAGQEAFRWVYYGELTPNTYTLKVTGWPLIERIENGMGFVRPFLAEVWVLLILVGTALLFDFRKGKLLLAGASSPWRWSTRCGPAGTPGTAGASSRPQCL